MSQEFDAIYENGVLRPLKPVELREHEVVSVVVAQTTTPNAEALAVGEKQRRILLAFADKMESLADPALADGASNRDHDRLIYGG